MCSIRKIKYSDINSNIKYQGLMNKTKAFYVHRWAHKKLRSISLALKMKKKQKGVVNQSDELTLYYSCPGYIWQSW